MRPVVQPFFEPATSTMSYLVHDPDSGQAVVIDPVLDFTPNNARISTASADVILEAARAQRLEIKWLLETHAHADHISAAHYMREKTGAPIVIGAEIVKVQKNFAALFEAHDVVPDGHQFDRLVSEADTLQLGAQSITILQTPGHTPACITYLIGDAAFVGDTLFMPDYGTARADFPGGSAKALYRSITKILALPDETRVFVGHDYLPKGRTAIQWESSVAEQRRTNIHVHDGVGEADFVAMRAARDTTLDAPRLILPSLQANIRAGALPPPSEGGHVYLKIPVNAI